MNDLQQRALALHEAGVIRLGNCPCVGLFTPDTAAGVSYTYCVSCGGRGLGLSRGGILLACVEAGAGIRPDLGDDRGRAFAFSHYSLQRPKWQEYSTDPVSTALAALEAANG